MKLTNILLAFGLAALPASALALDGDGSKDDAATLVQKLGDKDYKVRRDAYKQLEKLGETGRTALEGAAKSDDAEVRWNASRLLDRLDDKNGGGLKERRNAAKQDDLRDAQDDSPPRADGWRGVPHDLQQQMRELERRMQELQREFSHDGLDGFHVDPNFGQGWPERFGQVGQNFGQGGDLDLQPGSSFSRSSSIDGRTESFSIRVDANGHVTAEEQKDGKTTKVEADSIEAFRADHPEMLHRGPLTIAIRPFGQNGQRARVQAQGQGVTVIPGMPTPPQPDTGTVAPKKRSKVKAPKPETPEHAPAGGATDAAPVRKPWLGVELAPVPAEVADYLELDGDAFQIVRVLDDMPAAKRGLKARDILLEVNGQAIHEFDDVVKALDGADPNVVKIVVLRRGQRKEL